MLGSWPHTEKAPNSTSMKLTLQWDKKTETTCQSVIQQSRVIHAVEETARSEEQSMRVTGGRVAWEVYSPEGSEEQASR